MRACRVVRGKLERFRSQLTQARRAQGTGAAVALTVRKLGQAGVRLAAYGGELVVDRRYGIRTAGFVRNEAALRALGRHSDANYYQAITLRAFREVLAAADVDPRVTSFVDLGAGRGRAMVLAAEHGFPRVLGVELDPELAEQARANATAWQARRRRRGLAPVVLEVETADAAQVRLPPDPLLVFVYNSFGETTLRDVLATVVASHAENPRRMTICYLNPVHADVLARHESLVTTARTPHWMIATVQDVSR